MHIPASLLIDLQAFYPAAYTPSLISWIPEAYSRNTADPLIGPAFGFHGPEKAATFVWFLSLLSLEAAFQVPTFFLGAIGIWNDNPYIYILILIYASSTFTTLFPCLAVLFTTPLTSPETIAKGITSFTADQRNIMYISYIPWLIIPLIMVVDMAWRVKKLVGRGLDAEKAVKAR